MTEPQSLERWPHGELQDKADKLHFAAVEKAMNGKGDTAIVYAIRALALEVRAHGELMGWLKENRV